MTDTARHTAWTDEQVEAAARAHHDALYPNIRWGAISEGYEEKRIAAMRAALAALTKATGALNMTTERERIARIIDPEAAEMVGRKTVSKMIKRANESDWAVALAKADAIIAARQPSEGMVEGMGFSPTQKRLAMALAEPPPEPVELTPALLSDLKKIATEALKVAPGEWGADRERSDGYDYAAVEARLAGLSRAGRLVDTLNADHTLTEEDRFALCAHIAAFNPITVLSILSTLTAISNIRARVSWKHI